MNELPIANQIRLSFAKANIISTSLGVILGSAVPLMVYVVSHELPGVYMKGDYGTLAGLSALALGGCFFSFSSVMKWGELAFQCKSKAIAFAILLEGMLIMSGIHSPLSWLGILALAYLALINALSTGCCLTLAQKEYRTTIKQSKASPASKKRPKKGEGIPA